jgi:hypothetical protein
MRVLVSVYFNLMLTRFRSGKAYAADDTSYVARSLPSSQLPTGPGECIVYNDNFSVRLGRRRYLRFFQTPAFLMEKPPCK